MQYVNLTPVFVTAVACLAAAAVTGLGVYQARGSVAAVRAVLWVLLFGAFAGVAVVTLGTVDAAARVPDGPVGATNWVPLRDIASMLRSGNTELVMLNLAGNVALFVPVGLFAALVARRWSVGVATGVATSLLVESLQYGLGRSVDVDDVLLNEIGAVIGAAVAVLLQRAWPVLAARPHVHRHAVARLPHRWRPDAARRHPS